MKKFGVVLLLVVASIAVLSACGSTKTITTSDGSVTISDNGKSVSAESSNGSKVEATDQKVTINSENGGKTEITSDKTLPDTFPKDVPLPDNAAIDGSVKSSIEGTNTVIVTLFTDMSVNDVSQLYSKFMKDNGYQNTMETVTNDMSLNSGTLNKQTLQVVSQPDEDKGKTMVMITWIDETNKKQ
ncbi:hypothetical protein [Brevibacillus reuszeri]|uniref:hypothetical protein n=1 Tax=Brevibacillus reuszeri TaxID=54915 RepID=UPI00289B7047|nr:hypothetical protein [Brevibacillus reuszeri]